MLSYSIPKRDHFLVAPATWSTQLTYHGLDWPCYGFGLTMQWSWTVPIIFLDWPKVSILFLEPAQERFWTHPIIFLDYFWSQEPFLHSE